MAFKKGHKAHTSSNRRNPGQVFKDNPLSRKAAMDAMCFHCMGGETEPYVRLIKGCTSHQCPLHSWRPYK